MAPALTLPMKGDVLHLFYRVLLPKIRVNRNFLKAMVLVATTVRGLGLKSLELEQGLERLGYILVL